jgi:hypothetical protein
MPKLPTKTADKAGSALAAHANRMVEILGLRTFTIETRGAKARWNWEKAAIAVFGRIYRGEVPEPTSKAEVVALLAEWFQDEYGREPGETTLKEHGELILDEVGKSR